MSKTARATADFIAPLYINGLKGRVLRLPPPKNKKREILLLYGHHANIERMLGLAEDLNRYGGITLPDLPGFGDMQSFYKLGEKPTIDNLADYLAAFIKLRYRGGRFTIVAMSFGFAVATRMLQRYPELAKKVDLLVSVVGFVRKDDFKFKRRNYLMLLYTARLFSTRLTAWVWRYLILRPWIIRRAYLLVADKHTKMKDASPEERDKRIAFEIKLWHCNDVRTYMFTSIQMLTIDLCKARVDLPVYHIAVEPDRYFNNHIVEQHMRVIFNDCMLVKSKMSGHAPTVVADATAAAPFIPRKIRRLLAQE